MTHSLAIICHVIYLYDLQSQFCVLSQFRGYIEHTYLYVSFHMNIFDLQFIIYMLI